MILRKIKQFNNVILRKRFYTNYVQGQCPEAQIREYFYYINHQGMLFLDDAKMKNFTSCFKEKKFLAFFFKRLRKNNSNRYTDEFPYLSLCGRERNFVRCDDLPVVFTHIIQDKNDETKDLFSYGHAGELLVVPFQPEKLFMNIKTGRVYHPGPEATGSIGLITSKLAIEFSNYFQFVNENPKYFIWKEKIYNLDEHWFKDKIIN